MKICICGQWSCTGSNQIIGQNERQLFIVQCCGSCLYKDKRDALMIFSNKSKLIAYQFRQKTTRECIGQALSNDMEGRSREIFCKTNILISRMEGRAKDANVCAERNDWNWFAGKGAGVSGFAIKIFQCYIFAIIINNIVFIWMQFFSQLLLNPPPKVGLQPPWSFYSCNFFQDFFKTSLDSWPYMPPTHFSTCVIWLLM